MRRRPPSSEDEFKPFAAVSGSHSLRPLAIWLWNDRLDPQEVRRQVRMFSEGGFGAIVIRPGNGLLTPFLSDGWLDAVEAAVDEARRADLQVILHDGGRAFPTPGRSRWLDSQYQRKTLRYEILDDLEPGAEFEARPESLALFSAAPSDAGLSDFQRMPLPAQEALPASEGAKSAAGALEPGESPLPDALESAASSVPDAPGSSDVIVPGTAAGDGDPGNVGADVGAGDVGADIGTEVVAGLGGPLEVRVEDEDKLAPEAAGRRRIHFFWEAAGALDPLDPAAVRAFLDSAYELCYREFGSEYAHCIVGMAAELPDFEAPPWSPALLAGGEELLGRDALDLLPAVLLGASSLDARSWSVDRHDYWRLVSHAYTRAFSSQLQQWCGNRDILLLAEGDGGASLPAQLHENAGLIPALLGASLPAASTRPPASDTTSLNSDAAAPALDVVALKSAVSAARHAAEPTEGRGGIRSRSRAISAVHPLPGADSSRGSTWWIAAVQAALGAGSLHVGPFLYSNSGDRKRETPGALAVVQPADGDLPRLNTAIERLLSVMNAGTAVTELLVIHPLRTGWTNFVPGSPDSGAPSLDDLDQSLADLAAGLVQCGRDFDFVDESVLADRATVVEDCLQIGESLYRAIVLPDTGSLASTTVDLLAEFIDAGGVVVAAGRIPADQDGAPSERPAEVLGSAARSGTDAASIIQALSPVNFRLTLASSAEGGVYCQHRDTGRRQFVLVANISGTNPAQVHLTLRGQGCMELWDCETAELTPVIAEAETDSVSLSLTVPGGGVALLAMDTARPALNVSIPGRRTSGGGTADDGTPDGGTPDGGTPDDGTRDSGSAGDVTLETVVLPDRWTADTEGPNLLVLDRASAKLGAGNWGPIQRLEDIRAGAQGSVGTAHLRFQVEVAEGTPLKGLMLVVEQPKLWSVTINGNALTGKDEGGWLYPSQRKFNVQRLLRVGPNVILLTRVDDQATLEEVCLVGNFAARIPPEHKTPSDGVTDSSGNVPRAGVFRIEPVPREITGDLARAGLAAHWGTTCLHQTVSLPRRLGARVFLEFGLQFDGSVSVKINGHRGISSLMRPVRMDVTDLIRPGKNRIEIQLAHRKSANPAAQMVMPLLESARLLFTARATGVQV